MRTLSIGLPATFNPGQFGLVPLSSGTCFFAGVSFLARKASYSYIHLYMSTEMCQILVLQLLDDKGSGMQYANAVCHFKASSFSK